MNLLFRQLPPCFLVLATVMTAVGCKPSEGDYQSLAEKHVSSEIKKWMAGDMDAGRQFRFDAALKKPPVSFEILSVLADEADFMARSGHPKEEWQKWPAYLLNIQFQWQSESGAPMETVRRCNVTWNPHEKKWTIQDKM